MLTFPLSQQNLANPVGMIRDGDADNKARLLITITARMHPICEKIIL